MIPRARTRSLPPIAGVLEQFGVQVHDMSAGGSVAGVVSGAGGKTLTFNVSEQCHEGLNIGDPVTVEEERNGLQRRDL